MEGGTVEVRPPQSLAASLDCYEDKTNTEICQSDHGVHQRIVSSGICNLYRINVMWCAGASEVNVAPGRDLPQSD